MLVGREAERSLVDRLLDDARSSRSGVLVLVGEPGIGKTALLEHAVAHADGMLVLRAQGVESESELAFAGLHELLRPIVDRTGEIPQPQADALRSALLLTSGGDVDVFAVYAAVLSVLAAASDAGPVLLAIDDAQWLDAASSDALVFAGRRLGSEGIAMLVTLRANAPSAFLRARFRQHTLVGLDREAAAELVGRTAGRPVAVSVVDQLVEATAGNALALVEVVAGLSDAALEGRSPLGPVLPGSRLLDDAFAGRLEALPPSVATAVLVAAVSEADEVHELVAAAEALGADAEAFEAAEEAGVIVVEDGRLHFAHPLLRAAALARAAPPRRRAAHRALADAVRGARRAERRAWHLAAASLAPDEEIAAALESAADSYRRRSGYLAAARALERAARLSPDDVDRARRLIAAAVSARRAGRASWARELLAETDDLELTPELRIDVEFRRAAIEAWQGPLQSARDRYVRIADHLEASDPERAASALAHAAAVAVAAGDTAGALIAARRAAALGEEVAVDERTEVEILETLGSVLLLRGLTSEGLPLIRRVAAWFEEQTEPAGSEYVASCLIWVEDYTGARRLLEPLVEFARHAGDLRTLTGALEFLGELEFRTGRWSAALAAASESVQLADETEQTAQLGFSLGVLALIEAAQGRESCARHAERARAIGEAAGLPVLSEYVGYALGLLELGAGSPEKAAAHLDEVARYAERVGRGDPGVLQWAGDHVEALIVCDRRAEAEEALERLERQAAATGRAWAHAAAHRCLGLLAPSGEYDACFEEALRWEARAPVPFERARIELGYGQRLRRDGRRVASRGHLRAALELFERLGARPWEERARRELRASGETLRRRDEAAGSFLTPHELQVALVVAGGASNREAATRLFLSPKTIESHLSSAYRKLDVRSRVQLAQRLREEAAHAAPGTPVGAAHPD